tara:strand:+ start:6182 stop:7015 length:834 start_codon:yes stop_codon:yes gene_type:complete
MPETNSSIDDAIKTLNSLADNLNATKSKLIGFSENAKYELESQFKTIRQTILQREQDIRAQFEQFQSEFPLDLLEVRNNTEESITALDELTARIEELAAGKTLEDSVQEFASELEGTPRQLSVSIKEMSSSLVEKSEAIIDTIFEVYEEFEEEIQSFETSSEELIENMTSISEGIVEEIGTIAEMVVASNGDSLGVLNNITSQITTESVSTLNETLFSSIDGKLENIFLCFDQFEQKTKNTFGNVVTQLDEVNSKFDEVNSIIEPILPAIEIMSQIA